MNLRHLKYFIKIVDIGSLTRRRTCFTSPSPA